MLLKHGDTFDNASFSLTGGVNGAMLGTYDTTYPPTTKAKLQCSDASNAAFIAVGTTNNVKFMDLEFDGESKANTAFANSGSNYDDFTFARLNIHHIGGGIELSLNQISSGGISNGVFLHDSTLSNIIGGGNQGNHGILVGAQNVSIQGNSFSTSTTGEHHLRLQFIDKGVVSHNHVDNSASGKEMIALRSPCDGSSPCQDSWFPGLFSPGESAHTKKVVISENDIEADEYAGLHVGPVASTDTWGIQDIIIEGNLWDAVATVIRVDGSGSSDKVKRITIRNEIIDKSGTANNDAIIAIGLNVGSADPTLIWTYHNSIHGGSASYAAINYAAGVTGEITNNLFYSPTATTPDTLSGGSATVGTNSSDSQAKNNKPWTGNPPSGATGWGIDAAEYADGAGDESIPVFDDYAGTIRNLANMDLGAVSYNTGNLPGGAQSALRPAMMM